jgi:hypothetical protein
MQHRQTLVPALACLFFLALVLPSAAEKVALSTGQTVYVPAYSHIYTGNRELPILLTVTLSIRNVDAKHPLTITAVDYYETQGKLLRKYLDKPVTLPPFASTRYIIPQKDKTGGSGANFLVDWRSELPINPPLIESIMIGAELYGISFTSRGQEITRDN